MDSLLAAPPAKFLQLNLPLDGFLVLVCIIIAPLANGTLHGNQIIGTLYFCHVAQDT